VSVVVVVAALVLGFTVNAVFFASSVQAAGFVQPESSVQLNFPVAGPITEIDVRPGDVVHTGQVLAKEDDRPVQAKLAADQATLAADQQKLQQLQAPLRPEQVQQLQAQVDVAAAQLRAAQQKAADTAAAQNAAVSLAASQEQSARNVLAADQARVASDAAACAAVGSAAGSAAGDQSGLRQLCGQEARQVAADQAAQAQAQAAHQQAISTRQLEVDAAASASGVAQTQLATASGGQAVGLLPGTAADIAAAQASIVSDNARIASDEAALSQTVVVAPSDGLVGAVGGIVGDIASQDGVRQFSAPQGLPQQPSSGIQIFPAAPQQPAQPSSQFASLVTLNGLRMKIVAQVGESDVATVRVGQRAHVTLPAVKGKSLNATVERIEPTAVNQSGHVYYLVDLALDDSGQPAQGLTLTAATQVASPAILPGLSANVSF